MNHTQSSESRLRSDLAEDAQDAQNDRVDATLRYEIDAEDRVVSVGSAWNQFAQENGGTSCTGDRIVGRSLWDFVRDDALQMLYRSIFETVRREGRAISFPYRCDSPDVRRFLRLAVAPSPTREAQGPVDSPTTDRLVIESKTEHTERVERPVMLLAVARGSTHLHRCSICLDIGGSRSWQPLEDALQKGLLSDSGRPIRTLYTVCPTCRENLSEIVANEGVARAGLADPR